MNAIAAHKDELEKLLENLSGDIAVSGITFVALVDAYITRLDANCPDISARVVPRSARINGELNMEPTLTQNCSLYYAHHRTSKPRATFFERFRAAVRKQGSDTHRLLNTRQTFQASAGFTETTAAERQENDPEMIVCVSAQSAR